MNQIRSAKKVLLPLIVAAFVVAFFNQAVAQEVTQVSAVTSVPVAASAASPEEAWNRFVDRQAGFSLEFPNDWIFVNPEAGQTLADVRKRLESAALPEWLVAGILEKAAQGRVLMAVYPISREGKIGGVAGVTVQIQPLSSPASSAYLAQVAAASAGESIGKKDPVPVRSIQLPVGPAHLFSLNQKVRVPSGGEEEATVTTIIFAQKARAIVFSCTAPASEAALFIHVFERIAMSLDIFPESIQGSAGGRSWKSHPVPSTGLVMDAPAPPEFLVVFGCAVPPRDPYLVGRLVGFDCIAGSVRFCVLMGFHQGQPPGRMASYLGEGPARGMLESLLPLTLDSSSSEGGRSSSESFRPIRQNGYEGIRWDLSASKDQQRVTVRCLLFATGSTAYCLAVYQPAGDKAAEEDAERVLASLKLEDGAPEVMGQIPPFLLEGTDQVVLDGTWVSRSIGQSGFAVLLPESWSFLATTPHNPPPQTRNPNQPQSETFSCEAKGISVEIHALTVKGVLGSASSLLMTALQLTKFHLAQAGIAESDIKTKGIDGYTIQLDATVQELTPALRFSVLITAREGRACSIFVTYRADDPIAPKVAAKMFRSVKP